MALFETVPFLQEALLFLLIFVITFAVLQKSKVLGDDVAKINSLVALAMAFIFVGFSSATDIISKMIPWVAVAMSVILMFLILWSFVGIEAKDGLPNEIKWPIIILSVIFMISLVLYATGWWTDLKDRLSFDNSFLYTVLAFVAVIGAVIYVVVSSKSSSG